MLLNKKRKRKKTKLINYKIIIDVIFIFLGIFLFLGIIYYKYVGNIGIYFINILKIIFGNANIFFPVILFFVGVYNLIYNINKKTEHNKNIFFSGLFLLYLSILMTFELIYIYNVNIKFEELDFINRNYLTEFGGGIFGKFFITLLYNNVGIIGIYIIIILLYIISLLMIFNSIKIFKNIENKIVNILEKKINKIKLRKSILDNVEENKKNIVINEKNLKNENLIDFEKNIFKTNFKNDHNMEWEFPSICFLKVTKIKNKVNRKKEIEKTARILENTLNSFGVKIQVKNVSFGPALTRYEASLQPGTKVSKIQSLSEDIALALAATSVRIEAPIPGKSAVGFEIPNKIIEQVSFKELIQCDVFKKDSRPLTFVLGKDITGKIIVSNLIDMPHLLIAGATGSGKSVSLNTIICSFLYKYSPYQVRFLMIDPKRVELTLYNDISYLVAPVITDPKKAAIALKWMVDEMEKRYKLLSDFGVRDINAYNNIVNKKENMPYIVIIIDELADLMMIAPADVETFICRLAQKARAAGIHLIVATQRPSVQVITGDIKSNIPIRIAFEVFSQVDARTILDSSGAEKLLGKGDMLMTLKGGKLIRIQGAYISEEEIVRITDFIRKQAKTNYFEDSKLINQNNIENLNKKNINNDYDDPLIKEAASLILKTGQASISMLQRKLKIGYNRAARLIDLLEEKKFIGKFEGSKSRKILFNWQEYEKSFKDN